MVENTVGDMADNMIGKMIDNIVENMVDYMVGNIIADIIHGKLHGMYMVANMVGDIIDVKNVFYVFYYFYKKRVFYFLERFLFSSGEIFYPSKPAKILLSVLNICIKPLLSDGFNKAAMKILS